MSFENELVDLILTRSIRIIFILAISVAAYFLLRYLINSLTTYVQTLDNEENSEFDFRAQTILRFAHSVGIVVILTTTSITLLSELNINIAPLIASVGVAGLALGLGAQTLVKDAISGFFILLEDQFHVGDSIEVQGIGGTVEHLGLRTTHLRDLNGTLHIIPNGDIRVVSNYTNSWSRVRLELMLPYDEDFGRIFTLVRDLLAKLELDPSVSAHLLESFSVSGPEELGDWGVKLRILAKAQPGQQWGVQRIVRRSILEKFQLEGIAFAQPNQKIMLIANEPKFPLDPSV